MDGILIVNKEKNYTSRDIVNIISKQYHIKKVGHTGTLDPLATGVLVICIGKATKLVEILTNNEKEYIAEIILGLKTDTLDITGNILEEKTVTIPKDKIEKVIKQYEKTYFQEVPMYSAVKINGKKLYEYARENIEIELPKKEVTIKKIDLVGDIIYKNNKTIFKIKCHVSKGTYIRSLVRDIAESLNTIGVMSNLTRTKQGIFSIEEAQTLNEINNGKANIISIEQAIKNYKHIEIPIELEKQITNGAIIKNIYDDDIIVFTCQNKIKAIYKKYEKDKTKIKPWKLFN